MSPVAWIGRGLFCLLTWITLVPFGLIVLGIPVIIFCSHWLIVTQLLRRIFRPDLGSPLTSIDFGFSSDNVHVNPRGPIACLLRLEGDINPDPIRDLFGRALVRGRKSANYERLNRLVPTFWLGYPFWRKLKNEIKIKNHLNVLNAQNVDDAINMWFTSKFKEGQPLWDAILIPGYTGEDGKLKSIFGVRFHHMIGDGLSLLYFVKNEIMNGVKIQYKIPTIPLYRKLFLNIRALFWSPLVLGQLLQDALLHRDYFSHKENTDEVIMTSVTLELNDLKSLRQHLSSKLGDRRISFMNVVLLCYSSVLRKVLLNYTTTGTQRSKVLKVVNIMITNPRMTLHPILSDVPTVCNHWDMGIIKLKIGEADPLKRLQNLADQESWLQSSGSFQTNLFLPQLSVIFPRIIYSKLMNKMRGTSVVSSTVPPIVDPLYLCGHLGLKNNAFVGLNGDYTSMSICCSAYMDKMAVSMVINRNVFPTSVAKVELGSYFQEELQLLLQSDHGIQNPEQL